MRVREGTKVMYSELWKSELSSTPYIFTAIFFTLSCKRRSQKPILSLFRRTIIGSVWTYGMDHLVKDNIHQYMVGAMEAFGVWLKSYPLSNTQQQGERW